MTSSLPRTSTRSARSSRRPRRLLVAAAAAVSAALIVGCSGDGGGSGDDPATVLEAARATLAETSGVRIELATERLPSGVSGVVRATGVGTPQPAFEGDITVATGGVNVDVPVVAVDGDVHAKLPFTTSFEVIDPSAYQAPDPAALMDPATGLATLLSEATDVTEGEQVRDGSAVLTSYEGTVPGTVVARIIPSADADAAFDAVFTINDDQQLIEAALTGPFYPDADALTYTVRFVEYGVDQQITAP